jgi:hypothetical protein
MASVLTDLAAMFCGSLAVLFHRHCAHLVWARATGDLFFRPVVAGNGFSI